MKRWHIVCVMVMTLSGIAYGMDLSEDDLHVAYTNLVNPKASVKSPALLAAITYTRGNLEEIKTLMIHSVERSSDDKALESSLINLAEKNPGSPVIAQLDWLRKQPVNSEWPLQIIAAQRGDGYHILVGDVNAGGALSTVRRLRLSALLLQEGYARTKGFFDHGDPSDDGSGYKLGESDGLPVVQRIDGCIPEWMY